MPRTLRQIRELSDVVGDAYRTPSPGRVIPSDSPPTDSGAVAFLRRVFSSLFRRRA